MRRKIFTFALTFFLFFQLHAQNRGDLVSYELIADKTTTEIDALLSESAGGIPGFFIGFLVPTTFDVQVFKVVYHTIDGRGNPTIASGALFIPKPYPCDAPLAAYLHGTITDEASVPSNLKGVETSIGWALATDGYVAALPDYIGMGVSPGAHPYVHAQSEATASIDMMRASRKICANLGASLNGQVFITGYSQGGHSTLATQREIERNHASEFDLEFVAAGAGPYDLSGTQKEFVFNNSYYPNPSFLPYLLMGYQEVYQNLYSSLSDVMVSPYAEMVPILLDGSLSVDEIDSQLPANWKTMFKNDFLDGIANNYNHPVNVDLRKNNLLAWTPRATTRLYYCTEDEQVAPANSVVAWFNFFMRGAGSRVAAIPLGPFKHRTCAPIALLVAKAKFDERRDDISCDPVARIALGRQIEPENPDLIRLEQLVKEENLPDLAAQLKEYDLLSLAQAVENEGLSKDLRLYPNPAITTTTLDLSQFKENVKSVKIFDTSGRLVDTMVPASQAKELEINVQQLEAGMYIITVEADKVYNLSLIKN